MRLFDDGRHAMELLDESAVVLRGATSLIESLDDIAKDLGNCDYVSERIA